MWKRLIAHTLTFGLAAAAPPTAAQVTVLLPQFCEARTALVEVLEAHYGEARLGLGLQSADRLVEIWRSSKTGSWTILATKPDGIACIVATGTNWFDVTPEPGGIGS